MQLHFGLIGKPVSHSFSAKLFEDYCSAQGLANLAYRCYELDEDEVGYASLHKWAEEHSLGGFNVTLPYKQKILSSLDCLSVEASAIGAVNCVRIVRAIDSPTLRLEGYNTDAIAFRTTFQSMLRPWHTSALIFGTGGAAQAVAYALRTMNIDYLMVSRHPEDTPNAVAYDDVVHEIGKRTLIINATPLGMMPHTDSNPCPCPHLLTPRHLCYDLVYNPLQTRFLAESKEQGATVVNGLAMLRHQALHSYHIWGI